MIKTMESENIKVGFLKEVEVMVTIKGQITVMTIDELKELRDLTEHFWNCNNLWNRTSEAIVERERCETDDRPSQSFQKVGMLTGSGNRIR